MKTPVSTIKDFDMGGISGSPLTQRSRNMVTEICNQTEGKLPVVGVGGIMTPQDAWDMLCAGASLVQVYTGFIYGGPGFVSTINRFLAKKLKEIGANSIAEIVGSRVK